MTPMPHTHTQTTEYSATQLVLSIKFKLSHAIFLKNILLVSEEDRVKAQVSEEGRFRAPVSEGCGVWAEATFWHGVIQV